LWLGVNEDTTQSSSHSLTLDLDDDADRLGGAWLRGISIPEGHCRFGRRLIAGEFGDRHKQPPQVGQSIIESGRKERLLRLFLGARIMPQPGPVARMIRKICRSD
jgi:hypothetical protein